MKIGTRSGVKTPFTTFLILVLLLIAALLLGGCVDEGDEGNGGDPETTAPWVIDTSPVNGASDVAIDTTISVTFSEAMDTGSAETAFNINPTVGVSFSWSGGNTVLTFTPTSSLIYETIYSVTVDTEATDTAGNPLTSAYSFSFTTGIEPDTTAPTVTGTSPIDGVTDAAINTTISVTFSEAMETGSTETAFSINPTVGGSFSWSGGNTVLTFPRPLL